MSDTTFTYIVWGVTVILIVAVGFGFRWMGRKFNSGNSLPPDKS